MHGMGKICNVFALDFDGVLCDSAAETGITAWRAGSRIWPAWQGLEPPAEYLSRFLKLRPVIETGNQAILLMRLIDTGVDDETIEIRFSEISIRLLDEIRYTITDLTALFNRTRSLWIDRDPDDWLNRHSFYPGIVEKLAVRADSEPVFILTTKQEGFVKLLLQSRNISLPDGHIFGLDAGKSKEEVLWDLSLRPEFADAKFHFVEDRLQTLIRVAAQSSLSHVLLYLADWGYNTPRELETARTIPRITIWNLNKFIDV